MVRTRHKLQLHNDTDDDYSEDRNNFKRLRQSVRNRSQRRRYALSEDSEASVDSNPVRKRRRLSRKQPNETDEETENGDSCEDSVQPSPRRTRGQKYLRPQGENAFCVLERPSRSRKRISRDYTDLTASRGLSAPDTDDDENQVRRSSRNRKLKYHSFNQHVITKDMYNAMQTERYYDEQRAQQRKPSSRHRHASMAEDETETSATELSSCDDEASGRPYGLRKNKPRTKFYEAAPHVPRDRDVFSRREPRRVERPRPSRSIGGVFSRSPAHKNPEKRRDRNRFSSSGAGSKHHKKKRHNNGRAAYHGSDSTSSSSSSSGGVSSDDERKFQRRKAKSMAKARQRCLPMNFGKNDVTTIMKDRQRVGASLADIDPMSIDRSIKFDSVGGLGKHIRALKEMVVFPLLYPEVFEKFGITPPRGVLFHGPPGTGKTLVARALANECSTGERKVSFFMRKGADCLSKWVGESERQLRMLFDQAYQMRPSIIFFDEIDGLAPVRSSRQDQIHSSIVSTLLALMDGLDSRGEIVIIGATNRIDSIDPALRRPGRFDREFLFPLPSVQAREQILTIHTKQWRPQMCTDFVKEVSEKCVGYCGADLKALCTEAALHALRRRYPQIYLSSEKLQIDTNKIEITARDWFMGMQQIVPASQRAMTSPARALKLHLRPILRSIITQAEDVLKRIFPNFMNEKRDAVQSTKHALAAAKADQTVLDDLLYCDEDDLGENIYVKERPSNGQTFFRFMGSTNSAMNHRPRLLLAGHPGQGQTSHVGPALLHCMERLPTHVLDLAALYAVTAKAPEESCANIFREARRTSPSIIYMPQVNKVCSLFNAAAGEVVAMSNPGEKERREFFEGILIDEPQRPPPTHRKVETRLAEKLPVAPALPPRKLTERELKSLRKYEERVSRELRLFLRDVLAKLGSDQKFKCFARPVDEADVPDYYKIIKNPMDLSAMMRKIDEERYHTAKDFLRDIDLITSNALEYNPDKTSKDKAVRHRACRLRDTANAIIVDELSPDFERECHEVLESRKKRGEHSPTIPDFYVCPNGGPSESIQSDREIKKEEIDEEEDDDDDSEMADGDGRVEIPTAPGEPKRFRKFKRVPIPRPKSAKRLSKGRKSPFCTSKRKMKYRRVEIIVDEFDNELERLEGENNTEDESKDDECCVTINGEVSDAEEVLSTKRCVGGSPQKSSPNKSPASSSPRARGLHQRYVTIDTKRLHSLLDKTVDKTSGCVVEKLERLYSTYSKLVFQHRNQNDKAQLTQDLEAALAKFSAKK